MANHWPQHAEGQVTCFVNGTPRSKGSLVSFFNRDTQAIVTKSDSATLANWVRSIEWTMRAKLRADRLAKAIAGTPVRLVLVFYFRGPASTMTPHTNTPDIDKLQRAVLDALTGVLYDDDKQVASVTADKWFVADPHPVGVEITAAFGQRAPGASDSERADPQTTQGTKRRRRTDADPANLRRRTRA